jgi:hypothetical protein
MSDTSNTFRFRTGPTLPSSCRVGEVFYKTGVNAGQYNCMTLNIWTLVGSGTGVDSVFGRTGDVVAQTGDYSFALISNKLDDSQLPDGGTWNLTNNITINGGNLLHSRTYTDLSSLTIDAFSITETLNPIVNSANFFSGLRFQVQTNGTNTKQIGHIRGMTGLTYHAGTGTVIDLIGGYFESLADNSGVDEIAGLYALAETEHLTGSQPLVIGLKAGAFNFDAGNTAEINAVQYIIANDGTGTVTVAIGAHVKSAINDGGGVITTVYGIKVDSQTVGSTNWAIYTDGATPSNFGGPIEFEAQASLGTVSIDSARIGCKLVAGVGEVFVKDEAGNETQISPHNFTLFNPSIEHEYPWSYYSKNSFLGVEINVDMFGAIKALERLTGKQFIYINNIDIEELSEDKKIPSWLMNRINKPIEKQEKESWRKYIPKFLRRK